MPVEVWAMPPSSLVELVNEWGSVPRATAGEQDLPYPAGRGLHLGVPDVVLDALDDAALTRVADRLYPAFASESTAARVDLVNDLLRRTAVRPRVVGTAETLACGWEVGQSHLALIAAAALSLREHLGCHGFVRLGICGGRHCADVYIDASPAAAKRFCSVTCQNRARVAAFRSRRAERAE